MKKSEQEPKLDLREVTREQKVAVVAQVLADKDLLQFAEGTSDTDQKTLTAWFVNSLVNAMEGMAGQQLSRRDPVARFLVSGIPVVLYAEAPLDAAITSHPDAATTPLHIYQNSDAAFTDQLRIALDQAAEMESKPSRATIVTEMDSAPAARGEKKSKSERDKKSGFRAKYDPKAESLPDGQDKNTCGDLSYFARMRLGRVDYGGLDTSKFEDSKSISQNQYESILEKGGGRWLWEYLHQYLISEEALTSKTPGRWFRDICVMCGVSTTMLPEKAWTGEKKQSNWNRIQLDDYPENTSNPYGYIVLSALRSALSVYLEKPEQAGYGNNTGRGNDYKIPAGSGFGLPTIQQEDGKEKVDPAAIEALLKGLFREHYVAVADAKHVLKQIKNISDAYREGAISRKEVLEANLIGRNSSLHRLLLRYDDSKKLEGLFSESPNGAFFNASRLCETLRRLNQESWRLPEAELENSIESLCWLPATEYSRFNKGKEINKNDAWDYATTHHDGTIGNLLATYRVACGRTVQKLPLVSNGRFSKQLINHYETGNYPEKNTCNRALSYKTLKGSYGDRSNKRYYARNESGRIENLFDLPMNDEGTEIHEDVKKYIENFHTHVRKKPEAHWKNIADIVDELADNPGSLHMDMGEYKSYPVLGIFTKGIQEERQHPLLTTLLKKLAEQLAEYPNEPFPLITLPKGAEVLVRRGKDGEEPKLLESEMHLWQDWLFKEVQARAKHLVQP